MSGTGCSEAIENILKASISETMRQFLTGTSRCRHVRTGGEVLHVRVVVHPQGGQADVAQDDPAVRDAPVLRALEAERVEAPPRLGHWRRSPPTRPIPATEVTVSFPCAILVMATSLVSG